MSFRSDNTDDYIRAPTPRYSYRPVSLDVLSLRKTDKITRHSRDVDSAGATIITTIVYAMEIRAEPGRHVRDELFHEY